MNSLLVRSVEPVADTAQRPLAGGEVRHGDGKDLEAFLFVSIHCDRIELRNVEDRQEYALHFCAVILGKLLLLYFPRNDLEREGSFLPSPLSFATVSAIEKLPTKVSFLVETTSPPSVTMRGSLSSTMEGYLSAI